jgi:hypothetical protein
MLNVISFQLIGARIRGNSILPQLFRRPIRNIEVICQSACRIGMSDTVTGEISVSAASAIERDRICVSFDGSADLVRFFACMVPLIRAVTIGETTTAAREIKTHCT